MFSKTISLSLNIIPKKNNYNPKKNKNVIFIRQRNKKIQHDLFQILNSDREILLNNLNDNYDIHNSNISFSIMLYSDWIENIQVSSYLIKKIIPELNLTDIMYRLVLVKKNSRFPIIENCSYEDACHYKNELSKLKFFSIIYLNK